MKTIFLATSLGLSTVSLATTFQCHSFDGKEIVIDFQEDLEKITDLSPHTYQGLVTIGEKPGLELEFWIKQGKGSEIYASIPGLEIGIFASKHFQKGNVNQGWYKTDRKNNSLACIEY